MEKLSARLNALEQGVRESDARIQHLNNMLQQQTALQAPSSGTSVPQPDLHREMFARVRECDGDDDMWPGWWFELRSFEKANHLGCEGMIERIAQETDATNLNNAVLSNADKKLSSSLYYVLGLTMTYESKSLKIVRNVAVGEGAIALHKLLAECQPDIVNRHLGLLMSTMKWLIRATDSVTAINELDLRITTSELPSGERMADTVKRGVLLKGMAPLAEVQREEEVVRGVHTLVAGVVQVYHRLHVVEEEEKGRKVEQEVEREDQGEETAHTWMAMEMT